MQQNREIPTGFERIDHHSGLTLFNADRGIVISIHERDDVHQRMHGSYPYRVSGAQRQHTFYTGSFDSLSHAEDKAFELARDR